MEPHDKKLEEAEQKFQETLKQFKGIQENLQKQLANLPNIAPRESKKLKKLKAGASITNANCVIVEFESQAQAEKFYKALDKWA